MRRHIGCHTHGNSRSPVYQQGGNPGGHHSGFLQCIIKIELEIHRILVQIGHGFLRDLLQAGLLYTAWLPDCPRPPIQSYPVLPPADNASDHSWAILTMASYTDVSPCGWYLPSTSPTILADFL